MSITLWIQIVSVIAVIIIHLVFNFRGLGWHLLSAGLFVAVYLLARKITGGKLGMGDVLFGFFQGCCLEMRELPLCLTIEVAAALIVLGMVGLLKNRKLSEIQPAPFIPFMSAGLIFTYLIYIKI